MPKKKKGAGVRGREWERLHCPHIHTVINGRDNWGQQFQYLCLLSQGIGTRGAGRVEGANSNQYHCYHHLPSLLMAPPRAGREGYTDLHLGNQLSQHLKCSLPSINHCGPGCSHCRPASSTHLRQNTGLNHVMNGINYATGLPSHTDDSKGVKV